IGNSSTTADSTLTVNASANSTFTGIIKDVLGSGTRKVNLTVNSTGGGILTLSGANTYTGSTTVAAGTLDIASATALGDAAAGTTIASGGELRCFTTLSVAEPLTVSGVGLDGGAIRVGGTKTLTLTGGITLGADATLLGDGGSNFSI